MTHQTSSSFFWGTATSGFQSEGGYNLPGKPQNNWAWAEEAGTVVRSGRSVDFWNRAQEDLQKAAGLGLNAFRMSIEWSRVQPCLSIPLVTTPNPITPPPFDEEALERYAEILLECRRLQMEPIVTLHHFVHPAWLGLDPWLSREILPLFDRYVETVITSIIDFFLRHQEVPPRYFITINEPNMLAFNHYAWRFFPSGEARGFDPTVTCLAHLLEAHARAYLIIHRCYAGKQIAIPQVSFNNYCSDLYWGDQVWHELFIYGAKYRTRTELFRKLRRQADLFDLTMRESPMEIHQGFRLL